MLQVIAALLALQRIVGLIPALCGAAAVLVVAPFAALVGWHLQKLEEKLKPKTDTRINLVSEAISSAIQSLHFFLQALGVYSCSVFIPVRV